MAGYTNRRAMAKIAAGQLPGPEMSLGKLSLTANMVRTYELVSSIFGPARAACLRVGSAPRGTGR